MLLEKPFMAAAPLNISYYSPTTYFTTLTLCLLFMLSTYLLLITYSLLAATYLLPHITYLLLSGYLPAYYLLLTI